MKKFNKSTAIKVLKTARDTLFPSMILASWIMIWAYNMADYAGLSPNWLQTALIILPIFIIWLYWYVAIMLEVKKLKRLNEDKAAALEVMFDLEIKTWDIILWLAEHIEKTERELEVVKKEKRVIQMNRNYYKTKYWKKTIKK